jgi:hypothetical protein
MVPVIKIVVPKLDLGTTTMSTRVSADHEPIAGTEAGATLRESNVPSRWRTNCHPIREIEHQTGDVGPQFLPTINIAVAGTDVHLAKGDVESERFL